MATDTSAKRVKMDGPLIGTHNGHFHADEALAVYLLRLLPTYASSPLIRTRDPALLETCHTVLDVGGEYSTENNRYDHHQRGFDAIFPGHSTKLSSAGLVYLHYGKDIIATCTGLPKDGEEVSILYEKIYTDFVEAFDANDNGISAYDPAAIKSANITKRFEDRSFTLASVVNRYNYATKLPKDPAPTQEMKQAVEDTNFARASSFVGEQFMLLLTGAHEDWLPARAVVSKVYHERGSIHPSKQIMVLPQSSTPWSSHLYNFEAENPSEPKVLYVLFPENDEPDSKWRIRSVSVENGAFENRKDLPDAWKGVRDDELSTASGIPGCVFVHAAGFIGGNKTKEGALAMAVKAIEA
ncbi:metal-dependent protein hydrolase [Pseudovirgaria hyperparasitica]|uniref:Metal-dependent protein hydrolase n=1 Tax=Pseudovirgaria hyperparasitica TaxID=470096 RepID=A0A6A6W9D2_9PEZI|nr:metal-dependent protein hydrolase [Pseudovirgaria hyperparasitica]KAF2759462.1 metal-dependent protein hydrolase [Pseudovirgaria hyperparasitica]